MKKILSVISIFIFALALLVNTTSASSAIVVSQFDASGWTFNAVSNKYEFIKDDTAPIGEGSLDIYTEKEEDLVQLWYYFEGIPLEEFSGSYDSIRLAGANHAAPSYWMPISLNDDSGAYIWAAYEPAYNFNLADVNYNQWTTWKIDKTSKLWFLGGPPAGSGLVNYQSTFVDILNKYPNAKVEGIVINQGSGNTGWHTRVDNVKYMDTVFDFELLTSTPTAKIEAVSKTSNANITIKGFANDNKVEITSHEFKITKPDGTIVNNLILSNDKEVEFDLATILGEPLVYGQYKIEYVVTNELGTKSELATHIITYQKEEPNIDDKDDKDKKNEEKQELPATGQNILVIAFVLMIISGAGLIFRKHLS